MAKITSTALVEIEARLVDLNNQVFKLKGDRDAEIERLFCEDEGLVAGESIVKSRLTGKEGLYHSVSDSQYRRINVNLKLKSGKFSAVTSLFYSHDNWEKV